MRESDNMMGHPPMPLTSPPAAPAAAEVPLTCLALSNYGGNKYVPSPSPAPAAAEVHMSSLALSNYGGNKHVPGVFSPPAPAAAEVHNFLRVYYSDFLGAGPTDPSCDSLVRKSRPLSVGRDERTVEVENKYVPDVVSGFQQPWGGNGGFSLQ